MERIDYTNSDIIIIANANALVGQGMSGNSTASR